MTPQGKQLTGAGAIGLALAIFYAHPSGEPWAEGDILILGAGAGAALEFVRGATMAIIGAIIGRFSKPTPPAPAD